MADRIRLDGMTDDALDALYTERDRLLAALTQAEGLLRDKGAALEAAMTAADALAHQGCHARLMGQCQRAERAEVERDRLARVVRRVRQMAEAWRERLPDTLRTATAVDALLWATETP